MFEQTFVGATAPARRSASFAASLACQAVVAGAALLYPLLHIASLAWKPAVIVYLPPFRPIEPAHVESHAAATQAPSPKAVFQATIPGPRKVPTTIATIAEMESAPILGGVGEGTSGGSSLPGLFDNPSLPEAKAPSHSAAPPKPSPVRVSAGVQMAKIVRHVQPAYPPLARNARISGVVRLRAIIGADGSIRNLELVSGHPLLAPAAMQAVSQWRYQPTLLSGEPVEVITEILVNFTLNQ